MLSKVSTKPKRNVRRRSTRPKKPTNRTPTVTSSATTAASPPEAGSSASRWRKHEIILQYHFKDDPRALDLEASMQGLRAGVDHLYPWSYAHNILNPMNVAMDKNDQPVILDFGSCRTFGETLLSGGSPDWVDEDFSASVAYQDLDALRKSETWLGERRVERRMAKSSEMLVGGGVQ
jgi:hypothetical protein